MYRRIDTRIKNDEKFREFDPFTQDLWFEILTNDRTNQIGLYIWRHAMAKEDLFVRWRDFFRVLRKFGHQVEPPDDQVLEQAYQRAWQTLLKAGLIEYHEPTRLLWVRNFFKYEPPYSYKNVYSWRSVFDTLPRGHHFFPKMKEMLWQSVDPERRTSVVRAFDILVAGKPVPRDKTSRSDAQEKAGSEADLGDGQEQGLEEEKSCPPSRPSLSPPTGPAICPPPCPPPCPSLSPSPCPRVSQDQDQDQEQEQDHKTKDLVVVVKRATSNEIDSVLNDQGPDSEPDRQTRPAGSRSSGRPSRKPESDPFGSNDPDGQGNQNGPTSPPADSGPASPTGHQAAAGHDDFDDPPRSVGQFVQRVALGLVSPVSPKREHRERHDLERAAKHFGNPGQARATGQPERNPNFTDDPAKAVITIPVIGGEIGLTAGFVKELSETFPTLDALAELKRLKLFFAVSAERRRKQSEIGKSILSWFSKTEQMTKHSSPARPAASGRQAGPNACSNDPTRDRFGGKLEPGKYDAYDRGMEERARKREAFEQAEAEAKAMANKGALQ